jgi:O-antigen/teichoic acid export membrane protein
VGLISRRRLARDSVLYAIGTVAARAVSILMLPLYTRFLTPEDYGVLYLLQVTLDVVAILVAEGTTAGVLRFYFKSPDTRERHVLLSTTFLLLLLLHAVGAALVLAAAPGIWQVVLRGSGSAELVRIAGVSLFLQALLPVPLLFLQARQRAGAYTAVMVARLLVNVALNVFFLVGLGMGVKGMLLGGLLANAIVGVPVAGWMLRRTGIRIQRRVVAMIRRFGVPYQFAIAASFLLTFGDRFILQAFRGTAEVGLYALAYQFGLMMTAITATPFLNAWAPMAHQSAARSEAERDGMFNAGLFGMSAVSVTVAMTIGVMARPVVSILTTEAFAPAAALIPIVVMGYLFNNGYWLFTTAIDISERTKYVSYANWISAGVAMMLYFLLIPPYGAFGAAWATVLSLAVRCGLAYGWAQRVYPIGWRFREAALLLLLSTGVVALSYLGPAGLLRQIGFGAALLGAYGLVGWSFVLTPHQRNTVWSGARGGWRALSRQLGYP